MPRTGVGVEMACDDGRGGGAEGASEASEEARVVSERGERGRGLCTGGKPAVRVWRGWIETREATAEATAKGEFSHVCNVACGARPAWSIPTNAAWTDRCSTTT
jgi:hypothetical protein